MTSRFDQPIQRRGTDCVKWQHYPDDVLPLWVADMDFRAPEPVIRALVERVEQGVFGYPNRDTALSQAIIDWLAERYDWRVTPDELVYLPGVIAGFHTACHTLEAPDDGVLVQTPVYHPIFNAARTTGKTSQTAQLSQNPDGSNRVDWEVFTEAFTNQTRLFILCNPHNPIGRVYRRNELERLAEICLQKGVTICSDEIHCDLVYRDHQHIPIAAIDPQIAQHSITLMAPSKTFNLPGLKFAFAVIPNPDLREQFKASMKGLVSWPNVLGRVATLAAYREGLPWLEELIVYLEANRDYVSEFVANHLPGVSMAKPEGTYLAWLDCRKAGIEGKPSDFFLDNGRVALEDGAKFGPGGQGFVRLNFGCPRSTLTEALECMARALNSLDQPLLTE